MKIDFRLLAENFERIYSPRLALRQVSLADAWPLHAATRNPCFNAHLLWAQPDHEAETLARVDAIVEATRRGKMAAMSAVVRTTGEWASIFRFQPHAIEPDWIEMGIWTSDRFWHGKYSLELTRMCIDAAFSLSDIPILMGASAPSNRSSCRLMEMCGMAAGPLVYRRHEGGSEVQLQEFTIDRAAWKRVRRHDAHVQVPFAGSDMARALAAQEAVNHPPYAGEALAMSTGVVRPLVTSQHSGPAVHLLDHHRA